MKKQEIEKLIRKAEIDRSEQLGKLQKQKADAVTRKGELYSRLNTLNPGASFEEFRQVQNEAESNDAYIVHLEKAERAMDEPTEDGNIAYKRICSSLQEMVNAQHEKVGKVIFDHLNEIEKIIQEIEKEDAEIRDLDVRAQKVYSTKNHNGYGGVWFSELGESFGSLYGNLGQLLRTKRNMENNRKNGQPF